MYSLLRIIKFAFQDVARNMSLSLMTVFMLVLMLLSVNTLVVLQVLTNRATSLVKDQVDVSIFFVSTATDEQVHEIRDYVSLFSEVTHVALQTREQVLATFRETHKDNPDIIASLDELGENPLGPTLIVKTKMPGEYQKIIDGLQVPEYQSIIEAKTFGDTQVAIKRIDIITKQVERFSLGLTLLFGLIAFFIIFNTVRVAIFTHRTEIVIKKLVGATNWFVRGPYLVEAVIFTLCSVVLAAACVFFAIRSLDPHVAAVFEQERILTSYFSSHILPLLLGQAGGVLLLTVFSSLLAMRKHLRA